MPVRPDKVLKSFQHIFTKTWLCRKYVATQQVILSASLLPPTLTPLLHAENIRIDNCVNINCTEC